MALPMSPRPANPTRIFPPHNVAISSVYTTTSGLVLPPYLYSVKLFAVLSPPLAHALSNLPLLLQRPRDPSHFCRLGCPHRRPFLALHGYRHEASGRRLHSPGLDDYNSHHFLHRRNRHFRDERYEESRSCRREGPGLLRMRFHS